MMVEFECVPLLEKVDAAVALVSRGEMLAIDALGAIVFGNGSHLISDDQARTYHGTCKHGHPWNEENTYYSTSGGRQCRACARILKKRDRGRQPVKPSKCHGCGGELDGRTRGCKCCSDRHTARRRRIERNES